ncbi:hypothetical protein MASR1M60_26220 [Rhodocyclaceae bacterium]
METRHITHEQPPARIVAGALAHLARHMETGCQRSAHLAAMLLEKVANDVEADDHLRRHARELVEILDRDGDSETPRHEVAVEHPAATHEAKNVLMGTL